MTRRDFVTTAIGAGGAWLAAPATAGATVSTVPQGSPAREFYELRRYTLRRGPMTSLVESYLEKAFIPACRRAGTGPVGVFNVTIGPDSPSTYVLIPHASADGCVELAERLRTDREHLEAGREYLDVAATSPAFVRIESSLLRAFAGMPRLELPFGGGEAGRRSRLFELRTYESHSEKAGQKKIEMFDTGEIALFRKAGMLPVFFGETIVGPRMPSLTYMLVYEDMEMRDRVWRTFATMPEWRELSSTPGFTDPEIVTSITNVYLRPAAFSEI